MGDPTTLCRAVVVEVAALGQSAAPSGVLLGFSVYSLSKADLATSIVLPVAARSRSVAMDTVGRALSDAAITVHPPALGGTVVVEAAAFRQAAAPTSILLCFLFFLGLK